MLEPYDGKLSSTVLRGELARKGHDLPGKVGLLNKIKITAFVFGLIGIINILSFYRILNQQSNSDKLMTILSTIIGALLLYVSIGILKKQITAWKAGFFAIWCCAILFMLEVNTNMPTVSKNEIAIIISACSIGALLVGIFWSLIWKKQKYWFISK